MSEATVDITEEEVDEAPSEYTTETRRERCRCRS